MSRSRRDRAGADLGVAAWLAVVFRAVSTRLMVLTGGYRRYERNRSSSRSPDSPSRARLSRTHPDAGGPRGLRGPAVGGRPLDLVVATVGRVTLMLFYHRPTVDKGLDRGLPAARRRRWSGDRERAFMGRGRRCDAAHGWTARGRARQLAPCRRPRPARHGSRRPQCRRMVGAAARPVVISLRSAWPGRALPMPHSLNLSLRRAPGFYALYLLEWSRRPCRAAGQN